MPMVSMDTRPIDLHERYGMGNSLNPHATLSPAYTGSGYLNGLVDAPYLVFFFGSFSIASLALFGLLAFTFSRTCEGFSSREVSTIVLGGSPARCHARGGALGAIAVVPLVHYRMGQRMLRRHLRDTVSRQALMTMPRREARATPGVHRDSRHGWSTAAPRAAQSLAAWPPFLTRPRRAVGAARRIVELAGRAPSAWRVPGRRGAHDDI